MKKTILMIAIFILAPSIAMADKIMASGPFNLTTFPNNGIALPRGSLNLTLTPLSSGISSTAIFDITCDIENPNFNKPNPVVIGLWGDSSNVKINGAFVTSKQLLLNKSINKFSMVINMASYINKSSFIFMNYDDFDSVYVKNCIAVYSTN